MKKLIEITTIIILGALICGFGMMMALILDPNLKG
jgi:hypothetical protein